LFTDPRYYPFLKLPLPTAMDLATLDSSLPPGQFQLLLLLEDYGIGMLQTLSADMQEIQTGLKVLFSVNLPTSIFVRGK
jgi:hypothetical protein